MLSFQLDQNKTDIVGATASGLCLIHCLATPFLFVAQAGMATEHGHGHGESPLWWGLIDILLLLVSLAAVYWAVRKTSKQWMKYALVLSWIFLAFIILNEKFHGFHLAEEIIYLPALSLVLLHIYNRKYCQCADENCYTVPNQN